MPRTPVNSTDQDLGNPSRARVLTPSRRQEVVVGAYDGIYSQMFRYPTFSLDVLLAEKGYDFVEGMLNLSACRAPFNLKRYAVLRDGWRMESAISDPMLPDHDAAGELATSAQWMLENIRDPVTDFSQDFRAVLFDMMTAAWTGFRLGEIDWEFQEGNALDGKHGLRGIWVKKCKQIGFDVDPRTMAPNNVTSYTPGGGYDFDIEVEKCALFVHNQAANDPKGVGDWRGAYKHWFRLDANLKFWALALERWGAPVLLLIYPAGSDTEMQAAQLAAKRMMQGSVAVIPDNVKYEVLKAPTDVFAAMQQAAEFDARQIALNVHCNVLSTGEGEHGSTSAGADVHQASGDTVYDALSLDMEGVITQQIIRRFIRYNYGEKALALCPRLKLRKTDEGDLYELAQMLQILITAGNMPKRSKIIRETLGLPPIDADEEAALDAQQAAEQEAAAQLADARNSNQIGQLSSAEARGALETLSRVIYGREQAGAAA